MGIDMTAGLGGKYLKSAVDIGEDDMVSATIREITQEEMAGAKKEICFVAYFDENLAVDGSNKGMVLNKGNLAKIIKWAGSTDTDKAVGICVMIHSVETQTPSGEPTTGLRLQKGAAQSDVMKSVQEIVSTTGFEGSEEEFNTAADTPF